MASYSYLSAMLWLCLHYRKFGCFTENSVNRKPFLVRTIFFSYQNFSQVSPSFKDAVEQIWRPTRLCQATKSFVPLQLSSVKLSYFVDMIVQLQNFNFLHTPNSIFCHSADRALSSDSLKRQQNQPPTNQPRSRLLQHFLTALMHMLLKNCVGCLPLQNFVPWDVCLPIQTTKCYSREQSTHFKFISMYISTENSVWNIFCSKISKQTTHTKRGLFVIWLL